MAEFHIFSCEVETGLAFAEWASQAPNWILKTLLRTVNSSSIVGPKRTPFYVSRTYQLGQGWIHHMEQLFQYLYKYSTV